MNSPIPSSGFCKSCGYPLRELTPGPTGYRCPECGRAFDPANSKTFRSSPQGRVARWLAKPLEWPVVILGILAAIGVMSVSRWKLSTFAPSTVDLVYYLRPSALWHRTSLVTWRDCVFTLSMLAAIFACSWWLMRLAAGLFARPRPDFAAEEKPPRTGRRHGLLAIALIVTATGAALGWPYRLAQKWTSLLPRAILIQSVSPPRPVGPPTTLSPQQTQLILEAAVIRLPQAEQRTAGLKLLMENHPELALPILLEAAGREPDSEVRSLELRLIGLHRDVRTADFLLGFMTHPDVNTRAAAADAIGILHEPTFAIPLPEYPFSAAAPTAATAANTRVDLSAFIRLHPDKPGWWPFSLQMATVPLRSDVRNALEQMMLTASSADEREAAARALVVWPPPQYKLRVAEWGVWLNDNGDLKLLQSVMDEIPTFVHRTGNPLAEFKGRINQIMDIGKPILHITVDQPMAVDVNVVIHHGRPWFAYPNPDDFAVDVETLYDLKHWQPGATPVPKLLAPLENTAIGNLPDVRQGYPWLEPHHIVAGPIGSGMGGVNELTGLGLRWQSLIVSPTRLPWMTLPDCGTDPRYAWWKRLRQVPSGWISSRGESERFLYYDGPTLETTPVAVKLASNQLQLTLGKEQTEELTRQYPSPLVSGPPPQAALLIHHRNGRLSGQSIPMPATWDAKHTSVDCTLAEDNLQQDQLITEFRAMLQHAGLTTDEADGLIASWRPQFFQTDGTRLLLIMSRQDYDRFCPIDVRPKPTELVRVGIVLTEFK